MGRQESYGFHSVTTLLYARRCRITQQREPEHKIRPTGQGSVHRFTHEANDEGFFGW